MDIKTIESLAMKNTGLPDDLNPPEQILFLGLRILYRDFKSNYITHTQAKTEKRKIIDQYREFSLWFKIAEKHRDIYNKTNSILAEATLSDCDRCKRFSRILTGLEDNVKRRIDNEYTET